MKTFWAWILAAILALIGMLIGGFAGWAIITVALGVTGAAWLAARAGPKTYQI